LTGIRNIQRGWMAAALKREKLLRFVDLMACNMKYTASRNTTRPVSSLIRHTAAPLLVGLAVAAVPAQVPRYHSPIEAPTPQISLPAAPTAVTPNGKVIEYPIVRVNDQIINNSDYERTQKQVLTEAQQASISPTDLQQRQKDLLRDMIDQQLLLSRGKELDINADAEVIRRLDEIRKQNHLDSMEALEKAVREQGISYEDWKSSIKNSVITQQVVRDEVGRNIRLTPKDEQAYYESHKQEFVSPERVRLSEILIPTPEDATDAQVQQAKAKADDVAAKLKDGGNFEALAKQYSGGPNADTGGELGEFKRGDLGKVLEDQTFLLKTGEWTTPIRTRQGYVILKVTNHSQAGPQPLSAVEDQVQQAMYEEAIQPALRAYLTKLRENAYIDVAPGFVDSGASPKQTKPVFQGAAPLPTKKKKQDKSRLDQRAASVSPAAKAGDATSKPAPAAKPASTLMANGKSKKIRREKIRFGQAPRNALPDAPEETLTPGADQGVGAASASQPTPAESPDAMAANLEPTASPEPERKKTRYTARQATMEQEKAANKVKKAKSKAAAVAPTATAEESINEKAQAAPLGLNGDTGSKKKKTKVKGAPKERIQEKAPAPPAPAPEPTPVPPRSVRQNGEPAVTPVPVPAPATPPPASATPPGAPVDTTPGTPQSPTPTPPQQ
jgi:peptidyl-prolyl cis-trans isomerase SurA